MKFLMIIALFLKAPEASALYNYCTGQGRNGCFATVSLTTTEETQLLTQELALQKAQIQELKLALVQQVESARQEILGEFLKDPEYRQLIKAKIEGLEGR